MVDDDVLAVPPLSEQQEEFLRALARVVVFLPRVLQADLGKAHGLTTSEFFALMHVSEAPAGGLRMGDLATRSALTLGAVTRVVKLLEDKGLVQRLPSPADGRVRSVVLTPAGRSRLAAVRPAQIESARRRIFDNLDDADLATCSAVLSYITRTTGSAETEF